MAWEQEYEHVDLAEMIHEIGLKEPNVIDRDGNPARHIMQIALAQDLKLQPDGQLVAKDGTVHNPREHVKQKLEELNQLHGHAKSYARRHGAPLSKHTK